MRLLPLAALLLTPALAGAQWQMQDSHVTADLRGIHNLGGGVAWASGTNGTVLRTEDAGFVWQLCAIPPGAEQLDFRAVQAFDNNTALVMSSGKGDLSRLYKTTDGCQTWKLVFTNPDPQGFWDALALQPEPSPIRGKPPTYIGVLLGDPVNGHFAEFETQDNGDHWRRQVPGQAGTAEARAAESIFAASNSALLIGPGNGEIFVTGGRTGARSIVLSKNTKHEPRVSWKYVGGFIPFPFADSAGAFSIALKSASADSEASAPDKWTQLYVPAGPLVAVGGDYKKPDAAQFTAAFSNDSGLHWTTAITPPHGYRSAVAYDTPTDTWITVGPNGTDVSTDNGQNWHALHPEPTDPSDADQHWNALSLPYVVGPHGRIATLRPAAIRPAKSQTHP